MTRKNYRAAAVIVRELYLQAYSANPVGGDKNGELIYDCKVPVAVENAFIELFQGGGSRFDPERFRLACQVKPQVKTKMSRWDKKGGRPINPDPMKAAAMSDDTAALPDMDPLP